MILQKIIQSKKDELKNLPIIDTPLMVAYWRVPCLCAADKAAFLQQALR
ncbi:hypothetical protein [Caedibacter taeniospiralis]|nr:hypothetical protein [Caedibacter taeniospiralis]